MQTGLPLHSLAQGRPPFLTVRWPVRRVSPLTSQVALGLHGSAAVCRIAAEADGFHGPCLGRVAIPVGTPALSRLSVDFVRLAVTGQFLIQTVLNT
jgi:hypothetical protein